MNTFNRILGVLLALAVMVPAVCVFLVAVNAIGPEQLGPFGPSVSAFGQMRPTAVAAGAAVAFLLGLLLLIAELTTLGDRRKRVVVKDDEMGKVSVSVDGIEELVSREARRVGGVREVRSRVDQNKNGLQIVEFVSVAPEASVPDLSRELQERTRNVVEHYVGRPVSEVSVDARLARPEKARRGGTRAL